MGNRIDEEITLLRKYYPNLEHDENRRWVIIHDYPLPEDIPWNKKAIDVCFFIPNGYPGANPYGIYVPADLRYGDQPPNNYKPSPENKPPFSGNWGLISWTPVDKWNPSAEIQKGSNLLNYVLSFNDRFKEGR